MRQFQVYENPSGRSRGYAPFVVVLQSHFLSALPTTVVAPLLHAKGRPPYTEIAIAVEFLNERYFVSIGELAAMDGRELKRPLGDLSAFEDAIRRALERLFSGF